MNKKKLITAIEQAQKVCNEMNKCTNKFILQDSINMMNEAITVTHSCKSDSEQLSVAWKALEWVGFTKGEEFTDDDIQEMLNA